MCCISFIRQAVVIFHYKQGEISLPFTFSNIIRSGMFDYFCEELMDLRGICALVAIAWF